jgi:hypothetical protein
VRFKARFQPPAGSRPRVSAPRVTIACAGICPPGRRAVEMDRGSPRFRSSPRRRTSCRSRRGFNRPPDLARGSPPPGSRSVARASALRAEGPWRRTGAHPASDPVREGGLRAVQGAVSTARRISPAGLRPDGSRSLARGGGGRGDPAAVCSAAGSCENRPRPRPRHPAVIRTGPLRLRGFQTRRPPRPATGRTGGRSARAEGRAPPPA